MHLLVLRHVGVELELLVNFTRWVGLAIVMLVIMHDLGEANPLICLVHVLIIRVGRRLGESCRLILHLANPRSVMLLGILHV